MLRKLKEFKLPEVEEKVLKFWKENQIFEKSLKIREGAKPYNFFEGPPTANGKPGIHHILGRAFKDVAIKQCEDFMLPEKPDGIRMVCR